MEPSARLGHRSHFQRASCFGLYVAVRSGWSCPFRSSPMPVASLLGLFLPRLAVSSRSNAEALYLAGLSNVGLSTPHLAGRFAG